MKATEFKAWLEEIDHLTNGQRVRLREKLKEVERSVLVVEPTEQGSVKDMVCPRCASTQIYRWGRCSNLPRYMCGNCKRTFNALTNTPLAGLPHRDKLLDYEQVMAQRGKNEARAKHGVAVLSGGSIICVHPRYSVK